MYSNNPIISFYKRFYLSKLRFKNCFYVSKTSNIKEYKTLVFYLADYKYIHFGDLLFFIPLIKIISLSHKLILILHSNQVPFFNFIINKYKNIIISNQLPRQNTSTLVLTHPYMYFDKKLVNYRKIGIGLPNQEMSEKYPMHLARNTCKLLGLPFFKKDYNLIVSSIKDGIFKSSRPNIILSGKYILFSPYIGSGKFRDLFKFKEGFLVNYVNNLTNNNNFKVILVGSVNDKFPKSLENYIDLRGRDITEVMSISTQKEIIFGVGFDNIWMHYFDIINKPYRTLFRGRFLFKNFKIHTNSINVSFYSGSKRKYLS